MNPEPESLEERVFKELEPPLAERGFKMTRIGFGKHAEYVAFARSTTAVRQLISPALVRLRGEKVCQLDLHMTVQIHRIMNLMQRYWHHLSARSTRGAPTVTKLIINVAQFRSPDDVSPQIEGVVARVDEVGIPFLEKWSSEEVLAREIEQAIGSRKLSIPTPRSVDRAEILLAIYLLRGEFDRFKEMVPVLRKEVEKENGGYYLATYEQIVAEMAVDHDIIL